MTKGEGQFVEWNGDRALAHAIRVFGATLTIEADAPWACLTSMAMTRAGLLTANRLPRQQVLHGCQDIIQKGSTWVHCGRRSSSLMTSPT